MVVHISHLDCITLRLDFGVRIFFHLRNLSDIYDRLHTFRSLFSYL